MIFLVALRKELLEQWRSYRLLIVGAVFIFFGLSSPVLAKLTPEILKLLPGGEEFVKLMPPPTIADAIGQYVKNLSQFGVVLALLMAMGSVAQEKERGTAALVLVKPMPRGVFLTAKLAALVLTFAISLAIAGIGAFYYTTLLFGPVGASAWLGLNALLLLFFSVYIAITLFCSTLSNSQMVAAGLAFAFVIVFTGLGAIPRIGAYMPSRLLSWGTSMVLEGGEASWPALGVSIGIMIIAYITAWMILERQEL